VVTVVVTPSIVARTESRQVTLRQWAALGLSTIVVVQDPALPIGHRSQTLTAQAALRRGLGTGADVIIYAEDDIDLDPRIMRVLPALPGRSPVSLWHRPRFAPKTPPPRGLDQIVITRAVSSSRWWGAQCVVLTRDQAARLAAGDCGPGGIDRGLRTGPMRITIPPLVGHRRLPRAASTGTHVDCTGYEGPRSTHAY
jgi:hypothetical protein